MLTARRYGLCPKDGKNVMLAKHFGSCRFIRNHFLGMASKRYAETGKGTSYGQPCADLTNLKKEESAIA